MKRARILLADDHRLISLGVSALLADQFELAAQVEDGRSAVVETLRLRPDLVILDISMPLLNGIDAARQIRSAWPEAKLLFLTMHSDPFYLREALQAGATGYLLKSSGAEELHDAIHRVLKGEVYLSKGIHWEIRDSVSVDSGNPARHATLTDRQKEVLQLLAEGHSNKEISAILGVSIKTVEFHRGQIMRVLGIHTVAGLTQFALRLGLISCIDTPQDAGAFAPKVRCATSSSSA